MPTVTSAPRVWLRSPTAGRYDDYIALFPAGADPLLSAPIKWGWAARSPSHIKLGVGSLE